VQVFDRKGAYLTTNGRWGGGPGRRCRRKPLSSRVGGPPHPEILSRQAGLDADQHSRLWRQRRQPPPWPGAFPGLPVRGHLQLAGGRRPQLWRAADGHNDTWYTTRIEPDPDTATLYFYLNGQLIGSHTPLDAAALVAAGNIRCEVSVLNNDANTTVTRYVDDVRITPVDP